METSVDDLLRIIGEQTVKIRLQEQKIEQLELMYSRASERASLHPLSAQALQDIQEAAE